MKANHPLKNRTGRGFTLVELLVVIAVIGILAGLVLSTSGYVQQKAARSRAQSEIAAMEAALESYKADNGIYPRVSGTDGIKAVYQALTGDGDDKLGGSTASVGNESGYGGLLPGGDPKYPKYRKTYMEIKPNMLSSNDGKIYDPWGEAYNYSGDPDGDKIKYNVGAFDLYSKAGETSGAYGDDPSPAKWITNW